MGAGNENGHGKKQTNETIKAVPPLLRRLLHQKYNSIIVITVGIVV